MHHGVVVGELQLSVAITQPSGILLPNWIEARFERQIMQVGIECDFSVVVVNLAAIEPGMAYAQLEKISLALAVFSLSFRQLIVAPGVDEQVDDGMIQGNRLHVPLAAKQRSNAETQSDVVNREQRWLGIWGGTVYRDGIEIQG